MDDRRARLKAKTWFFVFLVVFSNVFGNYFLKRGMTGRLETALDYITALFHPYAALGVLLLIVWMTSRMTLLSWADLSYVLPVTSIGYVLVAVAGRVFLNERITAARWSGILLIMAGVALVGRQSAPQSDAHAREAKAAE
jgi:drug/metabolite transporter (DMT)-like permease